MCVVGVRVVVFLFSLSFMFHVFVNVSIVSAALCFHVVCCVRVLICYMCFLCCCAYCFFFVTVALFVRAPVLFAFRCICVCMCLVMCCFLFFLSTCGVRLVICLFFFAI